MTGLNDPRVFFAAERTALAWNRTSLTLMAFGLAIERFGLFVQMLLEKEQQAAQGGPSLWFGLIFITLGGFFAFTAAVQYKSILKTLQPVEIPRHVNPYLAFLLNVAIAGLAVAMLAYLVYSHLS